ncbi:MAG: carboxypeptidase regulatory-like domain-containing protein [Cytophagales bacterium]|nr:carboxypeptidase regulatory-like domain-containing protein [Cytophagales bacterium]
MSLVEIASDFEFHSKSEALSIKYHFPKKNFKLKLMDRIIGFIVGILLLIGSTSAQKSIFFSGEVRDSTGAPMQFANVMAVDINTQTMSGFAVTNTEGKFRLSLQAGETYTLKITFIGYAAFEQIIQPTKSNDEPITFLLTNSGISLDELEIVAEMPVTIRGDTITYTADAFTQGDERKLEDVLEDLPGFQIDEEGQIKVQGKDVDKVLIDGKEFFEGDTKLATKNIPANVVDKVQLLQNYNDISPLRRFNDSDALALNIELKGDRKKIVFGDVTGAVGSQNRYLTHANAFYYDEKTNLNLIADANNIGSLAFTMNDYFRFAGGLSSLMGGHGSNFNVSTDQLGIPMAERNSARSLKNELGAFNFSLTPNRRLKLAGFLIGSSANNSFGSFSNRTYLQENGTLNESFLSSTRVKTQSGLGKFSLDYAPNYDLHLSYELFGRAANIENTSNQLSQVETTANDISALQAQKPWAIEHQLKAFYSLGEKDVVSLELGQEIQHQDPTYQLGTTIQPFQETIPMLTGARFNLLQNRVVETDKFEALGNYYRILNRLNHVNLSFGRTNSKQEYSSRMFQELTSGLSEFTDTDFRNDASFDFHDSFVGLLFKNKWGKLTWSPEINLHRYEVNHSQATQNDRFNRWILLPGFNVEFEIRTSQTINFNYNANANFMDIQRVVDNLVVSSYNFLETGNPGLTNSLFHSFNLNYRNFNMYNFFNIYGGLNYQIKEDDIQNGFSLNDWERIGIPMNILPVNRELGSYLNVEKRFDTFRIGLDGNWMYSLVNNLLGDAENKNINLRQSYEALISSRLWKKLSVRLTHQVMVNRYEGSQSTSKFLNQESSIRTNYKIVKGLEWVTTYSLTNYKNKSSRTKSQYDMLDSILRYRKEGSPWEFALEGLNMLNTRSIRRDSFSDNLISTYTYDIQQRYYMFRVMLDI